MTFLTEHFNDYNYFNCIEATDVIKRAYFFSSSFHFLIEQGKGGKEEWEPVPSPEKRRAVLFS